MITKKLGTGLAALFICAAFAFGNTASAAIISNTSGFSLNNGVTTPETTGSISRTNQRASIVRLDGFDSSLGTLLSASVTFASSWTLRNSFQVRDPSTCPIFCEDNVSGNGGSSQVLRVDLLDPNGGVRTQGASLSNGCGDNDGFCRRNSSRNGAFSGGLAVGFIPLNEWIGGADSVRVRIDNFVRAYVSTCRDSEDRCRSSASNSWSGRATVTYRYSAVPEPSTLGLVGLGLALAGIVGMRRRKLV